MAAKSSFFKDNGTTTQIQGSASASADAALASEQAAATSETNSAASAAAALVSQNAAAASAAAALVSENAAAASVSSASGTAADAAATAADRVQTGLDRTAASNSAAAAASDAAQASTDAAQVASDKTQTAADRVQTGQDVTASAASAAAALVSKNAAAASETQVSTDAAQVAADKIQTAADRVQTGQDVTAAANSASSASNSASTATTQASLATTNGAAQVALATTQATNSANSATAAANSATSIANDATQTAADRVQTGADRAATTASAAAAASDASQVSTDAAQVASDKAATAADRVQTGLDRSAASSEAVAAAQALTNAVAAAVSAASSANQSASSYDQFDDRYLGSKNTSGGNPTTDNDGNALLTGALMWDDTNTLMKVYNGSSWVAAYASSGGALINTNNLSDVSSASSARGNLGLGTAATTAASDYATAAQGTLAASALQSGDNVSALTNNAGYLTSVPAQSFSSLTGKPTTISGYGITDAFNGAFSSLSGKPTTIAGYGITDAFDGAYGSLTGTPTIPTNNNQLTNGAGYITSVPAQSFSSLTGKPTTISGYGITDVVGQFTAGTGITIAANGTIATTVTDTDTTYSAGSGLTLSGTTFSHTDTSSQASVNGSGRTYIQDITLDTYGHVTGLATATETVTATTSASDLTSGTLPDARFPSVLPAISGANLTNLPAAGIANVVEDTTPQLGGDLQSNGHDIDFADNDKAVFGANADLEVYSDGTSSFVHSKKAGAYLRLKSEGGIVLQAGNSENVLFAAQNGKTALYFDAAEKLETTSSGVTVTGTLAATAVTGDGSGLTGIAAGATGGGSDQIFYENGQTVTTNYTITNGKNAMSAGPITINTGVTVTVGTGETWTVV